LFDLYEKKSLCFFNALQIYDLFECCLDGYVSALEYFLFYRSVLLLVIKHCVTLSVYILGCVDVVGCLAFVKSLL